MTSDDSRQYFITIPNSNGESQTIFITPEILPEQLIPLVQKKQIKEEKFDSTNIQSVYKRLLENLTESRVVPLTSVTTLNNILDVNSSNNCSLKSQQCTKQESVVETNPSDTNSTASIIRSLQSNLTVPTAFILQTSNNISQSNPNISSAISSDSTIIPCSPTDNSSNYITALQLSQNNSNLSTLAFNQPQTLLQYPNQNQDSTNTVLIPIPLQNSNQFSQQQILVAAAAVANNYSQNCNDNTNNSILTSNASISDTVNATTLAKLISTNSSNALNVALNNSNSGNNNNNNSNNNGNNNKTHASNSDSSTLSRIATKNKSIPNNDEFGKRKEQRLLKNREAARECRRKKKEYVKCLENRVAQLEQQNKYLADEINRMKESYAKKVYKRPSNLNIDSSTDVKFINNNLRQTDTTNIKEDIMDSNDLDNDDSDEKLTGPSGVLRQLPILTPTTGTVTSIGSDLDSISGISILKNSSNSLTNNESSHQTVILNTAATRLSDKDRSMLIQLQKNQRNNSPLSVLLTSDHSNSKFS